MTRRLRDARFFLRGLFWLRPIPDHRDLTCWHAGQTFTGWIIVAVLPAAALIGIGVVIGAHL